MDRLPVGLKLVIPLTKVKTDSVTFWIWNVPQRFVCQRLCLKHSNVQEGAGVGNRELLASELILKALTSSVH